MTGHKKPPSWGKSSGFTLIELMVALFIFGLLAAAGTNLLFYSSNAQAVTINVIDRLASQQRLNALLTNDLAQVQPRISRDAVGQRQRAFGGGEGQRLLHYIRGGVQGNEAAAHSGLQRIEWRLDKDRLVRSASLMIDGNSDVRSQIIATDVVKATVRFRRNGIWQDFWSPDDPSALPQAVELIVASRGEPDVRRLFLVGAGR